MPSLPTNQSAAAPDAIKPVTAKQSPSLTAAAALPPMAANNQDREAADQTRPDQSAAGTLHDDLCDYADLPQSPTEGAVCVSTELTTELPVKADHEHSCHQSTAASGTDTSSLNVADTAVRTHIDHHKPGCSAEQETQNASAAQVKLSTESMQPCRAVLQNLSIFDEAEHSRHQQALRASQRAQAAQQQQWLWQVMSSAVSPGSAPAWMRADT